MEQWRRAMDDLPAPLRALLDGVGLLDPGVLEHVAGNEAELEALLKELVDDLPRPAPLAVWTASLTRLWRSAAEAAARCRAAHSGLTDVDVAGRLQALTAAVPVVATSGSAPVVQPVAPKAPDVGRWPTRGGRLMAHAETLTAKADAEAAERARWLQRLAEVVWNAGLPAAQGVELVDGEVPPVLGRHVGRGRRAATIRQRVRCWDRFAAWLWSRHGLMYPSSPHTLLEYLADLDDEGCPASMFTSVQGAVNFIELAGAVPGADRIGVSELVSNAVMEYVACAAPGRRMRTRKQAERFLIKLVVALENLVVDESRSDYRRMFAWVKVVKWWAVLRFDDLSWLRPEEVTWCGDCLHLRLTRTKTSGSGRKVPVLHAYVSGEAWFSDPGWLYTGWQLWRRHNFARDFFLARPGPELDGLIEKEATYADAAAMSKRILSELPAVKRMDIAGETDWVDQESGPTLLLPEACAFWTEHSERNGLPSAAAALGFPPEWTDVLGRWTATASACYVRSQRQRVLTIQAKVARLREASGGPDLIGETETITRLVDFIKEKYPQVSEAQLDAQHDRLCFFTGHGCHSDFYKYDGGPATAPALSSSPAGREDIEFTDDPLQWFDEKTHTEAGRYVDSQLGTAGDDQGEVELLAEEVSADVLPTDVAGGYVVARTLKRGVRMLHRLGACPLFPGVRCKDFEEFGTEMPKPSLYDAVCRHCWRADGDVPEKDSEGELGQESSSSNSDA